MRDAEARSIISETPQGMKIDISSIQGKHEIQYGEWGEREYIFYATAAKHCERKITIIRRKGRRGKKSKGNRRIGNSAQKRNNWKYNRDKA